MTTTTDEAEVQAPEAGERTDEKTRPVHTIGPVWTAGANLTVKIWKNPVGDGQHHNYRVTTQRSYKQSGEWKNTQSFQKVDLPVLAMMLEKAFWWIEEHQNDV